MCKKLPVHNLSNEGDDLILKIDVSNEQWSVVLKIKEVEKLCKYYSGSFNKTAHVEKENPYNYKKN